MKKVKVLLATYNGEKFIEEQIESILNQEKVVPDIIMSDDGSEDKTIEIVNVKYPKIRISENVPGTGTAAKNFLKMLIHLDFNENFEYVSLADQDDIWMPQKIMKAINMLEDNNASLYMSNLTKWNTISNTKTLIKKDYVQKKFDYLFEGGSAGCTYVFTKDFAKFLSRQLGILPKTYTDFIGFSHDWLIYFIARLHDYKVCIDANSYILYRIHNNNAHGQLNEESFSALKMRLQIVKNGWYSNHAVGLLSFIPTDKQASKILVDYNNGFLSRLSVLLTYNFNLMRSKRKFLKFFLLSIFFTPYSKR